jgi:hypothetical protein
MRSADEPWNKTGRLLIEGRGGGSFFNELGCFVRVRYVGHVAGIHFDRLGIGALRLHALLIRIDRPVGGGHHVPGGFRLPGGRLKGGERVSGDQNLRLRHECRFSLRKVRREVGMEDGRVKVEVAIVGLLGPVLAGGKPCTGAVQLSLVSGANAAI